MAIVCDILFLAIIGGALYQGYKEGFIRAVSSLISTLVALYGAGFLYKSGGEWLSSFTKWRIGFCEIIVFVVLLVLINRLVVFILSLLDRALRFIAGLPIIRTINRGLGAFCRGIEAIIFLAILIACIYRFSTGFISGILAQSRITSLITRSVEYISPFMAQLIKQ